MIRRARIDRSRAVIRCSGSGQPVEFRKVLFCRPMRRPVLLSSSANCCSDPLIASASTMHASLPDCTMTPRTRSSTLICAPSSTNIFDPPMRQARSLTGSVWSSCRRPAFSCSNTTYIVISLDIDAGGIS